MFHQEPVLVSQNSDGLFVVESLTNDELQAVSFSRSQAKKILERRIAKKLLNGDMEMRSKLKSVELEQRSFAVQPMHVRRHRRYPAGPSINVPVRVVRIVDMWDKMFGLLPDFGIEFYCPVESDFKVMLQDAVQSVLASVSPEEIVALWPPKDSSIDWVRAKLRPISKRRNVSLLRTLTSVAEPLGNARRPLIPSNLRREELQQIGAGVLAGNCLLVGETGVGKSTLLQIVLRELQRQNRVRAKESKSDGARQPKFWLTSASRLIAGMRYLGQWQERLEKIIAELSAIDAVLIVENLRELINTGGSAPGESLGAFLVPYVRTGQLRLVSETTPHQLDYCQRHLPALVDLLSVVRIEPLNSIDESKLIEHVLEKRLNIGSQSNTDVLPIAATIQRLCRQYLTSRSAPSASVPFVEQWLAKNRSASSKRSVVEGSLSTTKYSVDLAIDAFSKWTGLPNALLSDHVLLERKVVEAKLAEEVLGQDQACRETAGVVMRLKSAMNDTKRPFGCLLFCGPTGVGKTQMAKALSKYLFGAGGQRTKLIRLDMSEYQSVSAGERFLMDGEGKPSRWIQEVRNQPLQVILFDEIEKASTEVFDILLSLLDEGRLTDSRGNLTSFLSSVVLMTSNLGSREQSIAGFHGERDHGYTSAVRKALRPEFINRLDAIVPFSSLTHDHILTMTRKELREATEREGIQRLGLKLTYGERLVEHLARIGFSPTLGARPLQRTIEKVFVSTIAEWIVQGKLQPNTAIHVDWDPERDLVSTTWEF